jgi:HD-GYP domain-containing protein (c-di-GMP phosphodiesterase class II)
LHDVGKLILPCSLFDGHNISAEEYALVKHHAQDGFKALMEMHMFTALCAGFHHNLYKAGYGVTI